MARRFPSQKKRVFLVNTNPIRRKRERLALERDGHDVVEFGSRRDILDYLASVLIDHCHAPPDLIVAEGVGAQYALAVQRRLRAAGRITPMLVIPDDDSRRLEGPFTVLSPRIDPEILRIKVSNS